MLATMLTSPDGLLHADPAMPVGAYTTYAIGRPLRPASCQEFECDTWETGWETIVDPRVPQGPERILYIRHGSGRRYAERIRDDGVHVFHFYPHQSCFVQHRLPAREETYYKRGGDWRGNPDGSHHRFQRPDDWADSFANHQDKLVTAIERG